MASERSQLAGPKANAVKQILLNVGWGTQQALIDYTLRVGWDQAPWSDDTLGSKKWLPGYQIKTSAGAVWKQRGKITEESCELMAACPPKLSRVHAASGVLLACVLCCVPSAR